MALVPLIILGSLLVMSLAHPSWVLSFAQSGAEPTYCLNQSSKLALGSESHSRTICLPTLDFTLGLPRAVGVPVNLIDWVTLLQGILHPFLLQALALTLMSAP